jgi:hypothetical protein
MLPGIRAEPARLYEQNPAAACHRGSFFCHMPIGRIPLDPPVSIAGFPQLHRLSRSEPYPFHRNTP